MIRRAVIAVVLLAAGCGRQRGAAAPEIHYGQDACAACGMIISDERFAAGLVTGPPFEALAFDDLGCLLQYERSAPGLAVAARFVRDYRLPEWRGAEAAFYAHGPGVPSPMAFNLAACATGDGAASLCAERGGEVLDFAAVRQRFEAGGLTQRLEDRP